MKKSTRFEKFYLGLVFLLMYLPVAVVVIFSFNESKLPVRFTGFSFQWYEKLFADSAMLEALVNRCCRNVTDPLENKGSAGIHFHSSPYDTGDYPWHGSDGIFLYAEPAFWNAYLTDRTHSILHSLYIDGSKSKTCRHGSLFGGSCQRSWCFPRESIC